MEYKDEDIEKSLRSRHCPYCNEEIKSYIFTLQLIPFEGDAIKYIKVADEAKYSTPIIFSGNISILQMIRIVLSSTCTCGNISLWKVDKLTLDALTNKTMNDDGYGIQQFYIKEEISKLRDYLPDYDKETLDNLIKLFKENDDTSN